MTRPEEGWDIEDLVDELLDKLARVSEDDALLMAQLWDEEDAGGRKRAWQHAKSSIERGGLTDALDEARQEVGQWMQASSADFQGIGGLLGQEGSHVSARRAAAPAVLDAAAALLAQRDLQADDFDLLSRPWRIAMEETPERG